MSGVLLDKYCPDPLKFGGRTSEWEAAGASAHYIWYYFGAVALVSALALIVYGRVFKTKDDIQLVEMMQAYW